MNDRGMKKWRPFNAVIPSYELKKKDISLQPPNLVEDELQEYEEILKSSLYTHSLVCVTYIENNNIKVITDYVIKLDPIKKDIIFKTKKINFRQIVKVKNS